MKKRTAALAATLLLLALFLFSNPAVAEMLVSNLGITSTETTYDRVSVVSIGPLNDSFFSTKLTPGSSLSVSLRANPGDIDVLLMNQGNFTLWGHGNGGSYSTYPQSRLAVSNYSFVFANEEEEGQYYVILISHSPDQATQVLAHMVVTSPSQLGALILPLLLGSIGAVMMGYAVVGRRQGATKAGSARPSGKAVPSSPSAFCPHCGVALEPGVSFCPSCGRSRT